MLLTTPDVSFPCAFDCWTQCDGGEWQETSFLTYYDVSHYAALCDTPEAGVSDLEMRRGGNLLSILRVLLPLAELTLQCPVAFGHLLAQ